MAQAPGTKPSRTPTRLVAPGDYPPTHGPEFCTYFCEQMGGVSAQGFSLGIPSWHRHQVVQCKESLMRYVATMPNGIRNSLPQNSEVLSWHPVAKIGRNKNTRWHFCMEIPVWTISCVSPCVSCHWTVGAPVCTKRDERFSHPSWLHQVSDAKVPAKPGRWGWDSDASIWMVEWWPERFCVLPGLVTSHGTIFRMRWFRSDV